MAKERRFNDALMSVIVTEIMLCSGCINENMILPRYCNKGTWYAGEYYERCGTILEVLPKNALLELRQLVILGSKFNFKTKSEIKQWISKNTTINDCSLSII